MKKILKLIAIFLILFTVKNVDAYIILKDNKSIEGQTFDDDVFIASGTVVELKDCIVNGNIYVYGTLKYEGTKANWIYAPAGRNFDYDTNYYNGLLVFKSISTTDVSVSTALKDEDIPIVFTSPMKSIDGIVSEVKGQVAAVGDVYINGNKIVPDSEGNFTLTNVEANNFLEVIINNINFPDDNWSYSKVFDLEEYFTTENGTVAQKSAIETNKLSLYLDELDTFKNYIVVSDPLDGKNSYKKLEVLTNMPTFYGSYYIDVKVTNQSGLETIMSVYLTVLTRNDFIVINKDMTFVNAEFNKDVYITPGTYVNMDYVTVNGRIFNYGTLSIKNSSVHQLFAYNKMIIEPTAFYSNGLYYYRNLTGPIGNCNNVDPPITIEEEVKSYDGVIKNLTIKVIPFTKVYVNDIEVQVNDQGIINLENFSVGNNDVLTVRYKDVEFPDKNRTFKREFEIKQLYLGSDGTYRTKPVIKTSNIEISSKDLENINNYIGVSDEIDTKDKLTFTYTGLKNTPGEYKVQLKVTNTAGLFTTKEIMVKVTTNVESIRLDDIRVDFKEKITLKPIISPLDNDYNGSYTWSESIYYTVSDDFVLTPMGAGTTEICLTLDNGLKACANITITDKRVSSVSFNRYSIEIGAHDKPFKLDYTYELADVLPEDNYIPKFVFSSSDESIVRIEGDYIVPTGKTGEAIVRVSAYNRYSEILVISKNLPTGISIAPNINGPYRINQQGVKLIPTITPSDAKPSDIYWFTDGASVSVDQAGNLSFNSRGTTKVYASLQDGTTALYEIKVIDPFLSVAYNEIVYQLYLSDSDHIELEYDCDVYDINDLEIIYDTKLKRNGKAVYFTEEGHYEFDIIFRSNQYNLSEVKHVMIEVFDYRIDSNTYEINVQSGKEIDLSKYTGDMSKGNPTLDLIVTNKLQSDTGISYSHRENKYLTIYSDKNIVADVHANYFFSTFKKFVFNFVVNIINIPIFDSSLYKLITSINILEVEKPVSIKELIANIRNGNLVTLSTNNGEEYYNGNKEPDRNIATGDIIKYKDENGKIIQHYISVKGDVNGDGAITPLDYVKIKNHIMGTAKVEVSYYASAADANADGEITPLDYVRVKNYIMNGGGQ